MLEGLTIVDGANAGAWIAPRLEGGFGGKVEQRVPNGYEAYARILHSASDAEGKDVTWADVAEALGRTAHRQMQWHKLVGSSDTFGIDGSEWPGGNPNTGELDQRSLDALCRILATQTTDPAHCFFGLSTIYGWVDGRFPTAVQLRWPGRDFVIFSGPISAATQIGDPKAEWVAVAVPREPPRPEFDRLQEVARQGPNLIWPADHSWYVASEYDLDSTLVGGPGALIGAIMAAPELETWEVSRRDSLQAAADKINESVAYVPAQSPLIPRQRRHT